SFVCRSCEHLATLTVLFNICFPRVSPKASRHGNDTEYVPGITLTAPALPKTGNNQCSGKKKKAGEQGQSQSTDYLFIFRLTLLLIESPEVPKGTFRDCKRSPSQKA